MSESAAFAEDLTRALSRAGLHALVTRCGISDRCWDRFAITLAPLAAVVLDYEHNVSAQCEDDMLVVLRTCAIRLPVVLVAGHGDEHLAVRSIKLGAADYVRKCPDWSTAAACSLKTIFESKAQQCADEQFGKRKRALIPQCRIETVLHAGPHSVVYSAEHRYHGKVAVKVWPEEPDSFGMCGIKPHERSACASGLQSQYLVRVYDSGVSGGGGYLTMELFKGGSLQDKLVPAGHYVHSLELLKDMAAGLRVAHEAGLLHLDLKPSNVLFRDNAVPVISDFGASMHISDSFDAASHCHATPLYMSPEQIRGQRLDGRTDLYSLGIVLFEMLVGRTPYQGTRLNDVLDAHINAPIPRLPDEFAMLQPLLSKLLAKRSCDRFRDAGELLNYLTRIA